MTQNDIDNFNKAVDSLKLYRRYDIIDENNKDLLNEIYVDPVDNDGILNLCMRDNTTVLIGRKGTGKSTILMRMQNELRKAKEIMTCYIDVKNIYDLSKRNYTTINYLKTTDSAEIEQYSLQRQFILNFLNELIDEIEKCYNGKWEMIKQHFHVSKAQKAINKLLEIKNRIDDNKHLNNIELQTLQEVMLDDGYNCSEEHNVDEELAAKLETKKVNINSGKKIKNTRLDSATNERRYNRVFARIFEITTIVDEIKKVLQELSMKRLYLILDDYSEIDKSALEMFCDVIVNTLNNNSDNFVKLKISAYPGRVVLGELDRQKIDIRYLDYYQLYSGDKRDEMENSAIAYTRRLLENRIKIFTGHDIAYYFDTSKESEEIYCKYLFNMTLNVVRHMGLILDYAKEVSVIKGEKITLNDLNESSKRFYNERLVQFFEETKSAQMAYNERVENLQLDNLLNLIINKQKEIKSSIRKNNYTAAIFNKDRTNPYTSHFYVAQEIEHYLATLELNFFISKYNEMTNKSSKKVSIYALNYGLCISENLRWGKPEGNEYRTYFIESPFNFTSPIKNFLASNTRIYCKQCGNTFSEDDYVVFKKFSANCPFCNCSNNYIIEEKILSAEDRKEIEEIEKRGNLLEKEQFQLLKLLQYSDKQLSASDLAQELDISWQKVGWIAKKLVEDYYYLVKIKLGNRTYYELTDLGKQY